MQFQAFLPLPTLAHPSLISRPRYCPPRAKKSGGSGKKVRKPSRSKRPAQPSPQNQPRFPQSSDPLLESASFETPLVSESAPDTLSSSFQQDDQLDDIPLPVTSEARLKLPEMGSAKSLKRKRKPRASDLPPVEIVAQGDVKAGTDRLSLNKIRELTSAYRRGGPEAQDFIGELERNPDLMIQTGNAEGEYDITSAIIGTGRPNKQGIYVFPYLQSGHLLLLVVIILCAFIYYPGFPLTELEDNVRDGLKSGLALTFVLNACLAVIAFKDAKKRSQPQVLWAIKTSLLGYLALSELRSNVPQGGKK